MANILPTHLYVLIDEFACCHDLDKIITSVGKDYRTMTANGYNLYARTFLAYKDECEPIPKQIKRVIFFYVNDIRNIPDTVLNIDMSSSSNAIVHCQWPLFLKTLNIHFANMKNIPKFPDTLLKLKMQSAKEITHMILPPCLKEFDCSGSSVETFQDFPLTLLRLDCSYTKVAHLPQLPPNLKRLNVSNTKIVTLNYVPSSLIIINVSNTKIVLPLLHEGLKYLNYSYNSSLTVLSSIPSTLLYLNMASTNITELPPLPLSLKIISVCRTNITSMPVLHEGLVVTYPRKHRN